MKSYVCSPRFSPQHCHCSSTCSPLVKGSARKRKGLMILTLFLILCWTISAIWLISLRRDEQQVVERMKRPENTAVLCVDEVVSYR